MVCSPHIGILAGIAGGYAPPRYNFDSVKTSRYQRSSLYATSYQSTQNIAGISRTYQPIAIANPVYNLQKKSQYNLQTETVPDQQGQHQEKNKIFSASEQSHLPVAETIAYQSPLLATLNQVYTALIEKTQKTSAKNQLQKLIEKEMEALQMHQHSRTPQQVQMQKQHQLYN